MQGIAGILGTGMDPGGMDRCGGVSCHSAGKEPWVFRDRDTTLLQQTPEKTGPVSLSVGQETYTVVFDGALYNAREVAQELEQAGQTVGSRTDASIVLCAYAQWQQACLEKLNGVFAFAVWEHRRHRLFLARDRIGVKPLFYGRYQQGLLFASQIGTILGYPGFPAILDREGAAELLLLGPGRTPGCGVLKGIRELEPGCWGIWEDGKLYQSRYWKLTDAPHGDSFEQTVETVRWLVQDAVRRQMDSEYPVGAFLSGGLDSSLISSLMARELAGQGSRLNTFSLDYENNRVFFVPGKFQPSADSDYIGVMEAAVNSVPHRIELRAQELAEGLDDAVTARGLPGMADIDASLLLLCRRISGHAQVVLSGECADEIFGGYPWYRDRLIREQDGFPWAQTTVQRAGLLRSGLREQLDATEYVMSRYHNTLRECDILPETSDLERRMKQMVNLNFRWFMQTLLDRSGTMGRAASIQIRVPFCDYRIAEYLYRVPWEMKDHAGREKGLLRAAARGLLPEQILNRKKSPFPKTYDPAYLQLVRQRLSVLVQDASAPLWELVQKDQVLALVQGEMSWPWYGQLMRTPQTIAYLLQIDFWIRHFGVDLQLT